MNSQYSKYSVNRFFVGLIYANPTMMISISSPLLQVPAHHHHRLALRPHRLLQLQGPPVLQADQVSESFRPFVKPPVGHAKWEAARPAGSRSQSMCFATLSLFSTLVLLMVPPSLHRAINKNQPERAKAFHHTRNPSQSVLCSASNGIGSILGRRGHPILPRS